MDSGIDLWTDTEIAKRRIIFFWLINTLELRFKYSIWSREKRTFLTENNGQSANVKNGYGRLFDLANWRLSLETGRHREVHVKMMINSFYWMIFFSILRFKKQLVFGKIKGQFKIKHECQFELTFSFLVDCDAAGRMLALSGSGLQRWGLQAVSGGWALQVMNWTPETKQQQPTLPTATSSHKTYSKVKIKMKFRPMIRKRNIY